VKVSGEDRKFVWLLAYMTALHAMLPEDAPPGLMTTNFSENAKGVAEDAVEHFEEFMKQQPDEEG